MKNRYELRQYLRFQLEQMSAKNQQHQFEEMVFELARQRVSRSIIPATGPVQAGGDQGRDFESYRTYIATMPIGSSTFLSWIDSGTLVFGCTLQKTLNGKIKSDLATIFGTDPKPTNVYYYAAADLPVAKRHELQAFCKRKYEANLEILDGQAISDQLSDPDTFWIAEQFLAVPAELFPQVEADEDYAALRERWFGTHKHIESYSDFLEVKRGLRRSTFTKAIRADLGRWSGLLEDSIDRMSPQLERKALYEIAVAQLRGRGSLDPATWAVSKFFETLKVDADVNEVEDAILLASYAHTAQGRGEFAAPAEKVEGWRQIARAAIDRVLADNISDGSRYRLLLVRRHIEFDGLMECEADQLVERLLGSWEAAMDIAEHSPFADVDALENLLGVVIPIVGTHPRFQRLADRVDALVGVRSGRFAAASQGRKRAVQYIKLDQLVPAIDQLQRSKEGWFSAETMHGSILSMLLLADCYAQLWMPLAARYYAAAAIHLGTQLKDESVRPLLATAAQTAANSYLLNGEGLSYLAASGAAAAIQIKFATDPEDFEKHAGFSAMLAQAAQMRAMLVRTLPDDAKLIDSVLDAWPVDNGYAKSLKTLSEEPPWSAMTVDEIAKHLERDTGQGLFGDIGPRVRFQWKALGISWVVQAETKNRVHVEMIGAALQIALVDLADQDLMIVPSDIVIEIAMAPKLEPALEQMPDNGMLRFKLTLPENGAIGDEAKFTFFAITRIVVQASALPTDTFLAMLTEKMDRGLATKAFWVQPATALLRDLRNLLMPDLPDLTTLAFPAEPLVPPPRSSGELAWRIGVASTYSPERAREALSNRYRKTAKMARQLVPLLRADRRTSAILDALHAEGFLDWQILNTLMSIVVQLSVEQEIGGLLLAGTQDAEGIVRRAMARVENGSLPPLDLARFDRAIIDFQSQLNTVASLRGWDMQLHRATPDFEAIKRLLDVRFKHSIDDIDHEGVFSWNKTTDSFDHLPHVS